ncbi:MULTISPECIES: DNA replication terminus site-binding protein [Proteus]|uniref:DNA replication terminus site-binding protein n=1 Tax=Proteus penneri TaxID=102862 RepID=A0ABS0VZD1_9GAMM|nr:DNA replication terminus site-binding protein [Proteus penneri]NBM02278.1 DNA replication terminus site-binding protein [Proteus sp. G2671]NBM13210.1 DNA replication terminus site-binding protein [Proteus sp. G2670]NBM34333.1 DNA replication terminus site-binding protein [Proteus sp. G2664]NBM67822.1 DNA replication terminus site-binding protein [Proteus sp. G2663]NBM80775.1 DNA replication terminus site-binding protein [Proteus sp. G2659]NBM87927.1 DNA replication terminus site-binding pr
MNKYDLIEQFNRCFKLLETEIEALSTSLRKLTLLPSAVFELPDVSKEEEHDEVAYVTVSPSYNEDALNLTLKLIANLFIYDNAPHISSKRAIRLPGVLCFSTNNQTFKSVKKQVEQINLLKKQLSDIVTKESGISKEERFDFVHNQLKGLITLNAYRTLTLLSDPDTVRFGWANKNIIKNLTRNEVLAQLEKSREANRAVPPYTSEQWAERLDKEIITLSQLPENAKLKIKRPVKVQPIARVWYSELQKQVQYACPLPLLAFYIDKENDFKPIIGELPDYDADNIQIRHRPKAKKLQLIIPRMHLYLEK